MNVKQRRFISFDWALKRLLRSKANFEILEGFLSELLKDDIHIQEILESESNKEDRLDKYNRVDIKVKNKHGELILIEIQCQRQLDYLQRLLYGTAKVVTEHIDEGEPYANSPKVISVSIMYFDLGQGEDYIYKGTTIFKGMHIHDELSLSEAQKTLFKRNSIPELYPEYYLIKINRFNDVARDTLDEWIYFLKNEEIREGFTARGLDKAKVQLDILKLSGPERESYERYKDDLHYQASLVLSNYGIGKLEGRQEGEQIGEQRGRREGEKIGELRGRRDGEAKLLLRLLQRRFGAVPDWVSEKIVQAELSSLENWSLRIFAARSLEDVFSDEP
ncbi:MAG: Rpn family recombination-promoting nuclease/putative transposase [Magnetococcales bacterium]|nr:Rpn family recombination-promoting nuclease/putative transposase [Magnetococcales bacterium]